MNTTLDSSGVVTSDADGVHSRSGSDRTVASDSPTRPAPGCLLAIDFGGTKIAMATAAPTGERLRECEIPTLAEEGADRVLERMFEAASNLVRETTAATRLSLQAVAAVTPGIVEPDGIRLAPNNPGWDRLPLERVLRAGFDVDAIRVETDVKAAALAEARCGALAGVRHGLYVNVGTGLAAAAVIDGKVLHGANGAAGEIGYSLRGVPNEVLFADDGAPLEQFVSGRAIADRATAMLGRQVSARDAFDLAKSTPEVAGLIDGALEALAIHVANLVLMLDPQRIVLGGGMARVPAISIKLMHCLARAVPYPPEVVIATFGQGAALQGAIVAGMEALNGV
ncbi:Fructokinase [Pararobbsia alpina]|uniref:ROK family protein n=1 Tax=Pararobbsia alpina TaxID=621374 RepID=UPI0039A415F6